MMSKVLQITKIHGNTYKNPYNISISKTVEFNYLIHMLTSKQYINAKNND